MSDAQSDLAALVYDEDDDPDALLRDFAADLQQRGFRAVGLVQTGRCADASLAAVLVHSGEHIPLTRNQGPSPGGCALDVERLSAVGERIASALEHGAHLLIVNRFGKREAAGHGLAYLIDRAFTTDIPIVIAVSRNHVAKWVSFAGGRCEKLACSRSALDRWWSGTAPARRIAAPAPQDEQLHPGNGRIGNG